MDGFCYAITLVGRERMQIEYLIVPSEDQGEDVALGLTAGEKHVPFRYLYDENGSRIFEEICQLPEYYLSRTETLILTENAAQIAATTGACEIVELGSGSSIKTRLLLDAYCKQGLPLHYCPIDVSAFALTTSSSDLLSRYDTLNIHGFVATYEQALKCLKPSVLPRRMIAFIGSSIGNLSPHESDCFLQQIVDVMQPGDFLLLGVDLQKNDSRLEAAYNDAQGTTARFNVNLLHHLNSRFGGNFYLSKFQHVAVYNHQAHQIEIFLKSLTFQRAELTRLGLNVEIKEGETIRTEISRKFDLEELKVELEAKRLQCINVWTDPSSWCAVLLTQLH